MASHCNYVAADNLEAAYRVRHVILNTADFLAQHPELGRRIRNAARRHIRIRWFVVPRFRNYLIFYQPYQNTSWLGACSTRLRIERDFSHPGKASLHNLPKETPSIFCHHGFSHPP